MARECFHLVRTGAFAMRSLHRIGNLERFNSSAIERIPSNLYGNGFGFRIREIMARSRACLYSMNETVSEDDNLTTDKPTNEPFNKPTEAFHPEKKESKSKQANAELKRKVCLYIKRHFDTEGIFPSPLSIKELYGRREVEWAKLTNLCATALSKDKLTDDELLEKDKDDIDVYIRQLFGKSSSSSSSSASSERETNSSNVNSEANEMVESEANSESELDSHFVSENETKSKEDFNFKSYSETVNLSDPEPSELELSGLIESEKEHLDLESESTGYDLYSNLKPVEENAVHRMTNNALNASNQNQYPLQNNYGEIKSFHGLIQRISAIAMAPEKPPEETSKETSAEASNETSLDYPVKNRLESEFKFSSANASPAGFRSPFDRPEMNGLDRSRPSEDLIRDSFRSERRNYVYDREDRYKRYGLFLHNVPVIASRFDLQAAFSDCGNIVLSRVIYPTNVKKTNTIAFVFFDSQESLAKALHKIRYGIPIQGRIVKGEIARNQARDSDLGSKNPRSWDSGSGSFPETMHRVSDSGQGTAANQTSGLASEFWETSAKGSSTSLNESRNRIMEKFPNGLVLTQSRLAELDKKVLEMEQLGETVYNQISSLNYLAKKVHSCSREMNKIIFEVSQIPSTESEE